MPQTIVAVKPASSGSGASSVTRYIAESKRDPQKEELEKGEPRPLFSATLDNLTYLQANEILGASFADKAQADEVIHLVISLEPEQFEALGDTTQERKDEFEEIIRKAGKEIEKEIGIRELDWIAGIHLNTDNPHVHIAISREGVDSNSPRFKRIDHLPRTLLPHHEQDANGQDIFKQGIIAETVAFHLNQAIERHRASRSQAQTPEHRPEALTQQVATPAHSDERNPQLPDQHASQSHPSDTRQQQPPARRSEPTRDRETRRDQTPTDIEPCRPTKEQTDRQVLGRAMVVAAEVERLDRELNSLIEHGDKRRYRVYDASHDRTRQISQFDVHRRAETRAAAAVRALEITDPNERHEVRVNHYKAEVVAHEKALHDHNIVVRRIIEKTNRDLSKAQQEHSSLQAQVRAIVREYGQAREPLPTPLLTREELSKLQDRAINNGNPNRVRTLERIRESLAAEHNAPTRTDKEIGRLEGQLLVSRAEQAARAVRLQQFEQTKHQTTWQIGKEKYSLVYVDRQIAEKENASKIFGSPMNLRTLNIFPSARRAAATAAEEMKQVREVVLARIEDRKAELSTSLDEATKMTETLSSIFTQERDQQQSRRGERHEKELTRNEISRLVEHSSSIGEPAMLRQALLLESQYNARQQQPPSVVEQSSKALGREILSNISLKEAKERLAAFVERRDFVPAMVKDLEGKGVTARVFDFREPLHPFKWLVQRVAESKNDRHLRNEVNQSIAVQEAQLRQDLQNADQCQQLLATDADRLRTDVATAGHELPEATFTTKQIMQLEIYAHRQQDPAERDRILSLIDHAEQSQHVFTPQKFDNEKLVIEALAKDDPTIHDTNSVAPEHHIESSPLITSTDPNALRTHDELSPSADERDIDLTH